jgi:hypothetical protein
MPPDLKLIMTSVGSVAAAKALQDEDLCDQIKVSSLGRPREMLACTMNDGAPQFALGSHARAGPARADGPFSVYDKSNVEAAAQELFAALENA